MRHCGPLKTYPRTFQSQMCVQNGKMAMPSTCWGVGCLHLESGGSIHGGGRGQGLWALGSYASVLIAHELEIQVTVPLFREGRP